MIFIESYMSCISYISDSVHGIRKGEVLTVKHFLLGLGLHSTTDQQKLAQIANRLGRIITYDKVIKI